MLFSIIIIPTEVKTGFRVTVTLATPGVVLIQMWILENTSQYNNTMVSIDTNILFENGQILFCKHKPL
jgi:hypothetical protein